MQRPRIWTRNLSAERAKLRSYKSVCPKEHQILGCTGQCEEATWQNKMGWVTPNIRTWNKNPNEERANLMSFKADSRKRPLISGCNWGTTCMWFMWFQSHVSTPRIWIRNLSAERVKLRTCKRGCLREQQFLGSASQGEFPNLPWNHGRWASCPVRVEVKHSYYGPIGTRGITEEYLFINCWSQFEQIST